MTTGKYDPALAAQLIADARDLISDERFPDGEFPFPDSWVVDLAMRLATSGAKTGAVSISERHTIAEAVLTAYDWDSFPVRARKIIGKLVSQLEAAAQRASTTIWIVERTRQEDYGETKHVVSWHESLTEALDMRARLQTEFDQACTRVGPWHEVIETIYAMYEEHSLYRLLPKHGDPVTPPLDPREPAEHEAALIEQLYDWWHQESHAWQFFVRHEVMAKMTDPPRSYQELTQHHEFPVHYRCRRVNHDPAVTRAEHASGQIP